MKVSVSTEADLFNMEIAEDLELENFKALCEIEAGIPAAEIVLLFNGRPMVDNKKSLRDYGVKDNDLLMLVSSARMSRRVAPAQQRATMPADVSQFDFSGISAQGSTGSPLSSRNSGSGATSQSQGQSNVLPRDQLVSEDGGLLGSGSEDPAVIRDMLMANHEQLALLRHNNPRLAEALTCGDPERFAIVLHEQHEARKEKERMRIRMLTADPFDMEAQKLIATEIAQENINANMEAAMEYHPESFGTVHMLYINCRVNGHYVKAFIDSGAQTTIMSQECAERCNIMRLIDIRWAGIAKGIGTQKIIGRVHMGQIQIEGDFLASSFCILKDQQMDMLLGLDMLKRHQMSIDLKHNQLVIGSTGTKTPFLPENELPDCARLFSLSEEEATRQSETMAREEEDKALAEALKASATSNAGIPSGSSTGSAVPNPSTRDNFSESDVQEIIQIGFTRVQATEELRRQNGNKTQAIAALFARSFKM